MLQILFNLFLASLFIQFLYYFIIFRKLLFYKDFIQKPEKKKSVSIIICAKDEEKKLKNFLPAIYQQKYPNFEVVLIDDRSIDKTWEIMEQFYNKFPDQTKLVKVSFSDNPRFIGNKKYALTLGIKAAGYDHLLFTDADCKPSTDFWVESMMSKFTYGKQLVLGYGKYRTQKSWLNKIIRYETLQTALQYFSYALIGKAYMGVGRNLAFTKKLFFDNNGYYNHLDILSGDDDLFVNEVSTNENTEICLHPDSFTVSEPMTNWKNWIYQKRRHISTANYYKFSHKILLGLYHFSLIIFYVTAIILLISSFQWKIVLSLVLLRFIFWYFINYRLTQIFKEKNIILWLPFLELFLIGFQLFIFFYNLLKKPKYWTKVN